MTSPAHEPAARSTAERTLAPAAPGALGWRDLEPAPGETHHGSPPRAGGRVLAALVHLSDLHLCDAESPARQEHLDHLGDPGGPYAPRLGRIGTYRPQEILTVQVAVAALRSVHRLDSAPLTGAPLDALVVTGDLTDNAQRNELRWYTELLAGRAVTPRSGDPARSSWVGAPSTVWRPYFWHPDGSPDAGPADLPTLRYGYPQVPGLVEAARAAVRSPGAPVPWYSVHGNHDALLQGTVAPDGALHRLAIGSARVVGLGPRQTPLVALEAAAPQGPARYALDPAAPRERVVADPERALLGAGEFDATHASRGAGQHGPGRVAGAGNAWACDVGQVRLIAIDTVNPHGGWQGSLDETQLQWLAERLDEANDRYVVVASHHPSWTLTNAFAPPGAPRRVLADEVLALLLDHPGVLAWVAGHVHAHSRLWHPAPDRDGGLLEVTTSSLIDWPQQFRVLELVREPGGTIAVASTVVDHRGGPGPGGGAIEEQDTLASLSRTLAANDYRARDDPRLLAAAAGRPSDRNAVWRMPDPFP
ncbi:metallophosphoesterase [Pengzhenrongella sicca]|uniref:Metallophosphoesterase n=1 Tax=Pengzhenrongella sicca TaxID=2819238 RepID=A0A8A4Z9S1_9MICO|nr:metallophosphoesterase [Pengzhenrongella sicca]QTE28171.1 metallophosphoesterase [Pengzhenrongella sicca]